MEAATQPLHAARPGFQSRCNSFRLATGVARLRFAGLGNDNRYVMFDLLVGLANDQSIMGDHSEEEQALMKIQHEWAEARVKGDISFTRRIEADDCTIVWPGGRIVNKRGDLESMTGDILFLRVQDSQSSDTPICRHRNRRRRGHHQGTQGKARSSRRKIRVDRHICEAGRSMEGGRFANHSSLGKIIAYSYPSLL